MTRRPHVPASFFGIAVGLLAFANAWRVATHAWALPAAIMPALSALALVAWLAIGALYALKWVEDAAGARAEFAHPVQSSFVALATIASMLAAVALLPFSHALARAVVVPALAAQLVLGVWLQGRAWQGGRDASTITPAAYLPTVGQNFVAATASASFGWHALGLLFFGVGMLSWLSVESVLLLRGTTVEALPPALRPVMGIQLAPPVVGGVAWLALHGGAADDFALALLGDGVFQALMLARLVPWIRAQGFGPGWWAFSFGAAALPTLAIRLAEGGALGGLAWIAPASFALSNLAFAGLVARTIALALRGKLLPPAVAATA
jgi:tellurite resistance protein